MWLLYLFDNTYGIQIRHRHQINARESERGRDRMIPNWNRRKIWEHDIESNDKSNGMIEKHVHIRIHSVICIDFKFHYVRWFVRRYLKIPFLFVFLSRTLIYTNTNTFCTEKHTNNVQAFTQQFDLAESLRKIALSLIKNSWKWNPLLAFPSISLFVRSHSPKAPHIQNIWFGSCCVVLCCLLMEWRRMSESKR